MNTLYLTIDNWDLAVDSSGNIALASNPYAPVQDAASEIQTYQGEVYFNTLLGIPYQSQILGQGLPLNLYRQKAINAALLVPGVSNAQVYFNGLSQSAALPAIPDATSIVDYATIDYAIVDNDSAPTNPNTSPGRVLTGQVQITIESGEVIAIDISLPSINQFTLDSSQLDGPNVL